MKKTGIVLLLVVATAPLAQAEYIGMGFERLIWNGAVLDCALVGSDNVNEACRERCGDMGNVEFLTCFVEFTKWTLIDCGQFYHTDAASENCTQPSGDDAGASEG